MALPMAIYFHRITVFALPVNIFILPLLIVLMPAALLTLLRAVGVADRQQLFPAIVTAVMLHIGVGLVHLVRITRVGDFRIPGPLPWQSSVFCMLPGCGDCRLRGRANVNGARWQRCRMGGMILAAVAAVACRGPIEHPT